MSSYRVRYFDAESDAPAVRLIDAADPHEAAAVVYPLADVRQAVEVKPVTRPLGSGQRGRSRGTTRGRRGRSAQRHR